MNSLIQGRWLFVAICSVAAIAVPLKLLSSAPELYTLPPDPGTSVIAGPRPVSVARAIMAMPFSSLRDPEGAALSDPQMDGEAGTTGAAVPRVTGIVGRTRGASIALVAGAGGETAVVRQGDEFGGWKILSIGWDSVTFGKGAEKQVISLDYSNKADTPGDGTGTAGEQL
jgi:hypothetical protein